MTKKQLEFVNMVIEGIMEGIVPVIKIYIDKKVETTKKEIISEVKTNGKLNIEKLDETKNILKERSFNLAKDLFGDDGDFGTAYDELKNLSPKNPVQKQTMTNEGFKNTNVDTLEIDYNREVSMESVLQQANNVNESIITGEYKNPSVNMIKNLENQDFSKFLD